MSKVNTAATPTPEELARTAWTNITKEMDNGPFGFEAEEIIADAIRQHPEAQRAEVERLTKERDTILSSLSEDQAEKLEHDQLSRDNLRVLDYIADKIGLPHDVELDESNFCTWFCEQQARATTAEAALADLPRLIAVIGKLTGAPMDDPAGYGLDDCVTLLEEHEDAIAGIGWQIGLTGETERADQAETRAAAASSDASRHERLWRAAMRGMAANKAMHRAALAAVTAERDRMREALTVSEDFIGSTPHGENCFLHDTGEFARCRCGKDRAFEAVVTVLEPLSAKEATDA